MVAAESSSSSSSVALRTPEKGPSRTTTGTGTRRTVGRSRRRRPISTPASASKTAVADGVEEKENHPSFRSRRRTNATTFATTTKGEASTPMRSRRDRNRNYGHEMDDEGFGSFGAEKTTRNSSASAISSATPQHSCHLTSQATREFTEAAVRDFREALLQTSVSSSLWSDFPGLVQTLVRTSLSGSTTADSLGLDAHVSALLSLSRKLIKEVSAEASGGGGDPKLPTKKAASIEDNLFVAVHILRSMAFVLSDKATTERNEVLLKMFFHLISSTRSDGGRSVNKSENRERRIWIALAGYEGLAKVLSNYTIRQTVGDGKDRIVSFALADWNPRIFFVVPSTARRKQTNSSCKDGTMSIRQLSTIAFQTTMVVVKAMLSLKEGLTLPYGNMGIAESKEFDSGSDKTMFRWHGIALELLQRVHRPWLVLLASGSIREREVIKEVLSYSKGIHRMLWDAASTLKSTSNTTSYSSLHIERECLGLRKQAILHLLERTGIPKLDLLIRKTSFESGCTYAWKAASVFAQHLPSDSDDVDKSLLSDFYEDFDSVFARLNGSNPVVPLGFVEYRMYRSLHLESTLSVFAATIDPSCVDKTDANEDGVLSGNYQIVLSIVNLGIFSKTRIQAYTSNIGKPPSLFDENEATTFDNSLSMLEKLILAFNRQIIHRMDEIPKDVMNRILKVLCNLTLHKALFLATKRLDSDDSSSILTQLENELVLVATILTDCLGPLVSAFLNQNPQKAPQLTDLMMECFLRPLSLYEQLRVAHPDAKDGGRNHMESSMNLSKYITDILISDSQRSNDLVLPIQCLEKAAKSLYAIARQRNERSEIEESVLPLLYSLKIYDKLDSLNGQKKDYQISSRLFLLSSTFQSIGMIEESFFVSCLLVGYESEKHSTTLSGTSKEQNVLKYLAAKSHGLLPPSAEDGPLLPQIIRSLSRQMAMNLIKAEAYEVSEAMPCHNHFTILSTIELFLQELAGDATTSRTSHPLDSIQCLLWSDRIVNHETKLMHVFAVTEILAQVGRLIQQLSRGSELSGRQFESAISNYCHLHILLQQAIANLDLECPSFFSGLLGLVASASIVPSFSIVNNAISSVWEKEVSPVLTEVAIEITSESIESLGRSGDCNEEISWTLLSETLQIVVRNQALMIRQKTMETNWDNALFNDCINVAEKLVDVGNTNAKNDIVSRANYWAIWVATYLHNELEIRGDHDRAAIFSLWTLALAEKIEPHQPWFCALSMTSCAKDSTLLRLNKSLGKDSFYNNAPRGSALWIFEKEFQLCELRIAFLHSLKGDRESYRVQIQQVEDIRAELIEYDVEKSDNLFILHTWVLSTTYLLQTDIASAFGAYTAALKASQICQKCCQTILRRSSSSDINFDEWMTAIATSSVSAMATQRYIEIISRRPKLYYRLGDHRKVLAYTRSILEYLNIDLELLTSQEGQGHSPKGLTELLEAAPQVRLFLQMNSWASAPENTMEEFSFIQSHDLDRHRCDYPEESDSSIVHSIQDMIAVGDILYGESFSKRFQQKFLPFYEEATLLMSRKENVLQTKLPRLPLQIEHHLGMTLVDQIKLRDARRLLETSHESNRESEAAIRRICARIEESEFSCSEDKAWALYYIGASELEAARCSGSLQELWNEEECDQNPPSKSCDDENLRSARYHLSRALLYSSASSDIFLRKILRSLALAQGPKINGSIGSTAGILILRSIGQSTRRKLTWYFDQDQQSTENESLTTLKHIFGVFDGAFESDQESDKKIECFLRDLAARTPENWGFVAPVICPSGEMLVSIIQKKDPNQNEFTISTKCIFPRTGGNAYDEIVKPFDSILSRVHEQLKEVDPSLVMKSDDKESIKRKWWDDRNQLDVEMGDLIRDVESFYFSNVFDLGAEEDNSIATNSTDSIEELPRGNLMSQFEAAVNVGKEDNRDPEEERQQKIDILMKLTIPKLKDRLIAAGASKSQFRKLRKADLIELLINIEHDNKKSKIVEDIVDSENCDESNTSDSCLFLILDENLHRFPFEGMSMLKGKTVCRIPCLSFVLATLIEFSCPSVDPASVSYILNPENNLKATQDRLLPAIQGMSSSHRWDWDSVIGEIPQPSFFTEAFRQKDGLVMYFGHGGAQVCFSRRKVEELIEHRASGTIIDASATETGKACCRAAVLLMGCSSGKLVSINRKKSDSIEESPLYYEPEGVALSYVCAGAPCVIGNLWDVTDNDIDRFSIALMEDFFGAKNFDNCKGGATSTNSLAKSLSVSRSVCKLKHLVGCAPVCYGVPVYLKHN